MRPTEFTNSGRRAGIGGAELTAHLAAVLADRLIKHGLGVKDSEEIVLGVMDEVRRHYGGQNVYFPRDALVKTTERDMQIYERYSRNELSMGEIAQQYDISLQWAYAIVRTVRDKPRKEREAERAKEVQRWKQEN